MALTATAQSALREPVWDEEIVPTLRKRLQNESNVLARRISAVSVGSADDHTDMYQSTTSLSREDATTPSAHQYSQPQDSSAVPRANDKQARPNGENAQYSQFSHARARSLSQPYMLDPPKKTDKVAGSSAATPPMTNGGSAGRMDELHSLDEGHETFPMRSTVRIPRHNASDLFDEAPPFSSSTSSRIQSEDEALGRASSDSEERPFEHWYRGDISRNGGVGELRVGRRTEMLDIANYGHTLRNASSRVVNNGYQRSRSNSRSRDAAGMRHGRQRSESISATVRQGAFLDEDELAAHDEVLDEESPADVYSDGYEEPSDPYEHHPDGTASSPSLALYAAQNGTSITARHRPSQVGQSRIPTPSAHRAAAAVEPRTPTPTKTYRNVPSPSTTTSTPSTPRTRQGLPRSQTQPPKSTQRQKTSTPSSSSSTARKRGASPGASTSLSSAKKTKANKKPPSSMRRTVNKQENRRSIGQYPEPDGDDMMDAIPSWTQPVPPTGNWDDVVLPVVARKKGMEGHYSTADGSPKPPQQRGSVVFEPAPGTFGFDHTKYRRNPDTVADSIPMDEFGQRVDGERTGQFIMGEQPRPQPSSLTRSRSRPDPPPSPPPFAHYTNAEPAPLPTPTPASHAVEVRKEKPGNDDDDDAGGCCKCVIM